MASSPPGLASFKFEIFGKVQKVFFRKHTQAAASELGLVGWVRNTDRGTVVGEAQGPQAKLEEFRQWLRTKGSPKSKIEKAEFSGERANLSAQDLKYNDFELRR